MARSKSADDGQKVNTVAHEVYGPGNQLNVDADGGIGDGLSSASNANLRIALQALAFQLAWDIVMAHLVPGYMMQKASTLAAGFPNHFQPFPIYLNRFYI